MKSSIILATACATLALATPAIKTEVVVDYVTVTVTGTGPSPTAPAATAESTSGPGSFFSASSSDTTSDETPASSPEPQAPAASSGSSGLSDYAAPIIQAHNQARAQHSAPALEWDDNLASIAQAIGQTCIYEHNTQMGGGGYGQNIAAGAGADTINTVIYQSMYENEIVNYNAYGGEPNIGDLGSWGHATQIIWVGTQKVGCATVTCSGGLQKASGMAPDFTVCNYSPAGNMIGSFAENVLPN